jgi:hypothetical protein
MNLSSWNSIKSPGRRNPALSPAHITVEFEKTKKERIFAHKLGNINFSKNTDINAERQKVIDNELYSLNSDGFKFNNVGHVYSEDSVISKTSSTSYSYELVAHGHPLGGAEHGGMESCSRAGLQCSNNEGTNSLCNPGKCVIGTIEKVSDSKWKYTSKNTYGQSNLPLIYYLPASESVKLCTILRGSHTTYSSDGTVNTIHITKPASVASTILLPPKFYFSEDFIDFAIIKVDERLSHVIKKPIVNVIGVEDRKVRFVQNIAISAYPSASEGYLNDRLNVPVDEKIRDTLIEVFSTLDAEWGDRCATIINEEFSYRLVKNYNGLDLISVIYDRVKDLFESIIQLTKSSISSSLFEYGKELISRPLYSRLPGISEGYRSDPAFSEKETPSQWLTSGVDEFLSKKKDSIASFYADYLDPELCNPATLDWLAQHVGLFGALWNTEWDVEIKRVMIRNAFGWWDREASIELPLVGEVLTPKGEVLNKFPFLNEEWDTSSSPSNLLKIKFDEIESINGSGGSVKIKTFSTITNKISLVSETTPRVDKLLWNGLIESKGSLLGAVFLCSVFGLKAHSPLELRVIDAQRKILKPRTGLREAEIQSSVLIPYKQDVIQVGNVFDAEIGNLTNQLVAGVSRVSSVEESRNVFFRVPYYYNRDGKSWNKVSYIASNWMPSNLNVRVQYAYLSAGLWAVGDAFFEPDLSTPVAG